MADQTPTLRQVATGTHIPNALATGSLTTSFSRTPHILRSVVTALAIVLPNWYVNGQTETNAGSTTWTAAIEYPAGTYTRVTFAGANSVTSATGGNIVSDQIPVSIPKGATFWVRLFQNAPGKVVYSTFYAGDGTAQFTSPATDMTMGGTVTTAVSKDAPMTAPIAIIGMSADPAIGIYGDSISVGRGDTADAGVPLQGHLGRSFGASFAAGHVGISGDRMSLFLTNNAKRMSLASYFTHFAVNMGINDITNGGSAASVAADTNSVVALFPGPVALCTLSPVTTSTDTWATTGNQTTVASNAVRITENARRLAGVAGVKAIYDVNPAVETVASPESGIWKAPGFTSDGTHPNSGGYKAEAAAIDTVLLTVEIDVTAPVMTGSIAVSAQTTTGFTLAWPAATDSVGVVDYQVDNGSGTYASVGNVLTAVVTGKASATAFNVRVRAVDAAGNQATPLIATATTLAVAVPDPQPRPVSMMKYQNAYLGPTGLAIRKATVTVTKADGSPAVIYSDNGVTPITSLLTGDDGEFAFYAENGRYNLLLKKRGLRDETVTDVQIFDPADDPGVREETLAAAGGASLIGFGGSTVAGKLSDLDSAKLSLTGGRRNVAFNGAGSVLAIGRNADNSGADFQGLQIGGGEVTQGTDGTLIGNDGHASWLRFQPSKNESPVEMLLYPTAAQGLATATSGTNQVTRVTGSAFTAAWVGKKFYLGDTVYRVASVTNADSMTVTTLGGGAVSFGATFNETFHVAYIKGAGTCNVSGSTVTRTSGDPFIAFFGLASFVFKVNGIVRSVSACPDTSTYTLSAAPGDVTGTPYTFECDINDQLSTLRVQKLIGSSEENVSLYARYDGYWLASQFAGTGKYRPVILSTGEVSANPTRQLNLYANGDMTLGGGYNDDALRILARSGVVVNRFEMQAATAGFRMSLRARGEANAGMAFDVAGTGDYLFTGGSFSRSLFRITGNASADTFAAVDANVGFAALSAGGATNGDIRIVGRGTGSVDLRDSAGASKVRVNTTGLGFFGTAPAAKPTVSGSRSANAALASLITALAALGLVTDTTTS